MQDARDSDQQVSHRRPTARNGARLTRLLLAKSLAETVFVVALLAIFSYTHFNPRVRGSLDSADARTVEGWAVDESDPSERVSVQLFIDGHFVAQRRADRPRADLLAAGRAADADHGFVFETPRLPPREEPYEARVYALNLGSDREHPALRQVGKAARFRVTPGEGDAGTPASWWEVLEKR